MKLVLEMFKKACKEAKLAADCVSLDQREMALLDAYASLAVAEAANNLATEIARAAEAAERRESRRLE
ncbi:MAG: hypothetical protein LBL08_02380 [Candidatus Nomurabacteria bacterium]|jgi:hypothetical protein|nr:hypothetical protein [Candidatus Nomurabacteria bacterium]